jgi:hypothetical protein
MDPQTYKRNPADVFAGAAVALIFGAILLCGFATAPRKAIVLLPIGLAFCWAAYLMAKKQQVTLTISKEGIGESLKQHELWSATWAEVKALEASMAQNVLDKQILVLANGRRIGLDPNYKDYKCLIGEIREQIDLKRFRQD